MNIDFLKIEMHTTHLENGTSGLSSDLEGKGGARRSWFRPGCGEPGVPACHFNLWGTFVYLSLMCDLVP